MTKLNFPVLPDAEGGGRLTLGGEYGVIDFVTNLNNSGAGSFRNAVMDIGRTIHTPSMVIFRVSGNITLDRIPTGTGSDWIFIYDNKTILGASSPDGITLTGMKIGFSGNGNVVINHLASRPGDLNPPAEVTPTRYNQTIAMFVTNKTDVFISNCSFSWAIDEVADFYFVKDGTMQYCVISEALSRAGFGRGTEPNRWGHSKNIGGNGHGYGMIFGGSNASMHHNLFAHAEERFPLFNGEHLLGDYSPQPTDKIGLSDFRWNTLYNWWSTSGKGGAGHDWNVIDNTYIPGPRTTSGIHWGSSWVLGSGQGSARRFLVAQKVNDTENFGKFFLSGNLMEGAPTSWDSDNWLGTSDRNGLAVTSDWKSMTEHTLSSGFYSSTSKSRAAAHADVIAKAGVRTYSIGDPIDNAVKNDVNNRIFRTAAGSISPSPAGAGLIDRIENVGGFATYPSPSSPQIFDGPAPHYLPNWVIEKYNLDPTRDYITAGDPSTKPWQFIFFEDPSTSIGVNYRTLPSGYDWQNTVHHRVHKVVTMHTTGQINLLENTAPDTYELAVQATTGGTASIVTVGGPWLPSQSVTVSAVANPGYVFQKWRNVTLNQDLIALSTFNFLIPEMNTVLEAVFVLDTPPEPIPEGDLGFMRVPSEPNVLL